jgi:biotin synthase
LRLSYGSARFLNLISSGPLLKMETIYTMFGEKCIFDCAYCTQSKNSRSSEDLLSRVRWPEFEMGKIICAIERSDEVKRICLQVVSSSSSTDEAFEFLRNVRKFNIPISASVRISTFEEAKMWFDRGIERLGMATDVVDEKLYSAFRGGSFSRHIELLEMIAKNFPHRLTTHIIVGLGESEKAIVEFIQKMYDIGVGVGLFAFTPVKGTKLETHPAPSLESYRRIQLSHHLIKNNLSRAEHFEFSERGEIIGYGFDLVEIPKEVFQTSGCPNCTRPYYNEKPGKEVYNFFS